MRSPSGSEMIEGSVSRLNELSPSTPTATEPLVPSPSCHENVSGSELVMDPGSLPRNVEKDEQPVAANVEKDADENEGEQPGAAQKSLQEDEKVVAPEAEDDE